MSIFVTNSFRVFGCPARLNFFNHQACHVRLKKQFKHYKIRYIFNDKGELANPTFTTIKVLKELNKDGSVAPEKWIEFSRKLLSSELRLDNSYVNDKNIDGVIMSLCCRIGSLDLGQSFYEFLKSQNKELHMSVTSNYMRLCARKASVEKKDLIVRMFDEIRSSDVVDPLTGEHCIVAVSKYEDHWKEGLKMLRSFENFSLHTDVYNAIIEAAFSFHEPEIGWKLLKEMSSKDAFTKKPNPICYLSYFTHCEHLLNDDKFSYVDIEKLFDYTAQYDLVLPNLAVVSKLRDFVEKVNEKGKEHWKVTETDVNHLTGVCGHCNRKLQHFSISNEDLAELRAQFFSKAIVGSNIYLKSYPEELKKFHKFLEKIGPYDIVLDGLNIAYRIGVKIPKLLSYQLRCGIQCFLDKSWKVVVIGRRHMLRWPKKDMQYVMNNAKVFLADDLSKDDPFLLYATLRNGPQTYFCSHDLMRGHMHLLEDDRLKLMFRRWQTARQFRVIKMSGKNEVEWQAPLQFLPCAQKSTLSPLTTAWHVPYEVEYTKMPQASLEPPTKWLCIERTTKTRT